MLLSRFAPMLKEVRFSLPGENLSRKAMADSQKKEFV
jgi:hypothetical protein